MTQMIKVQKGFVTIDPDCDDFYLTGGEQDGNRYRILVNNVEHTCNDKIGLVIRSHVLVYGTEDNTAEVQVFSKDDTNTIWRVLYPDAQPPYKAN